MIKSKSWETYYYGKRKETHIQSLEQKTEDSLNGVSYIPTKKQILTDLLKMSCARRRTFYPSWFPRDYRLYR